MNCTEGKNCRHKVTRRPKKVDFEYIKQRLQCDEVPKRLEVSGGLSKDQMKLKLKSKFAPIPRVQSEEGDSVESNFYDCD